MSSNTISEFTTEYNDSNLNDQQLGILAEKYKYKAKLIANQNGGGYVGSETDLNTLSQFNQVGGGKLDINKLKNDAYKYKLRYLQSKYDIIDNNRHRGGATGVAPPVVPAPVVPTSVVPTSAPKPVPAPVVPAPVVPAPVVPAPANTPKQSKLKTVRQGLSNFGKQIRNAPGKALNAVVNYATTGGSEDFSFDIDSSDFKLSESYKGGNNYNSIYSEGDSIFFSDSYKYDLDK